MFHQIARVDDPPEGIGKIVDLDEEIGNRKLSSVTFEWRRFSRRKASKKLGAIQVSKAARQSRGGAWTMRLDQLRTRVVAFNDVWSFHVNIAWLSWRLSRSDLPILSMT